MNPSRRGIILAGGTGTRLFPNTISVSKQLMPVYDKPMIYYPLSVLMLSGIREVLIITTPEDSQAFQRLLGNGEPFGLRIEYAVQPKPEGLAQAFVIGADFIGDHPSCLILGDNLFYGVELHLILQKVSRQVSGSTIFAYPVSDPERYGVVEFDPQGKALSLEEKPLQPKSRYAVPGIYFYDKSVVSMARDLKPSKRGELEITDLNRLYLEAGTLSVEIMSRGIAWLDTGTPDSLMDASNFVQVIQKRQGLLIACPEEIAFRQGWIGRASLQESSRRMGKSQYSAYLSRLMEEITA
ncbi:MAG: glucose-1-phosphate thymidylyltransferase RfbA [Verrucomicrobiae bacterium]|nr:glucose-1-phosphate thymidylyltransferase RfbA [Verrucomicrobiae bacterium]